ncbi:MAG: periplasmic heavy metal sensor [Verrucomicrobiota bacterium]
MNRSLIILLGALALGATIFGSSYFISHRTTERCCTDATDELSWLRTEFHLSSVEMSRIRQLHEGYLPQCAEMCAKIATKKRELDSLVGAGTNLTAEVQARLKEIARLRAQCQAQMLQHFATVSQAMPPEQGQCYLSEMKRLTLGTHEQTEQSMSGHTVHEHQH